jgi:hypothetical protein
MTTTTTARRLPRVGDQVRVQRDETTHPPHGTWRRWRDRTGTVLTINRDRERPTNTEYGVVFGATRERPGRDGSVTSSDSPVWFLGHELAVAIS